MTLVRQTNTAKALSRRIMKYTVALESAGDITDPTNVEVKKYSTGNFNVELIWDGVREINYIHQFEVPVENYFQEKNKGKKVTVEFDGLALYGDVLTLELYVKIEDW